MKYLSLFSGIGGFELGIGSRGECIGFSEIDKPAIKVYQHHFPNHKNYGDITTINAEELPDFDLLVGGFPCQAFSIAGKRLGFADTRGTLFFDIARILSAKRPRLFLLENVKGLLSHDGGRTFKTIIATIDELGYNCQWQVLNSKNHGVPQNRERVFIAGHLRGTPRPEVFPFREDAEVPDPATQPERRRTQTEVSHTLRGPNIKADQAFIVHNIYGGFKETELRVFRDNAPTVRTPAGGGHLPNVVEGMKVRRLTPLESERLMGFPDFWTDVEGMSDTQRYKQCGNGVVVNVVRDIAERMLK
jgi:DNA (cytosine-5)-methyltransferase 1